jgi:hypothetical protein
MGGTFMNDPSMLASTLGDARLAPEAVPGVLSIDDTLVVSFSTAGPAGEEVSAKLAEDVDIVLTAMCGVLVRQRSAIKVGTIPGFYDSADNLFVGRNFSVLSSLCLTTKAKGTSEAQCAIW